jgi:hypothetical protein
VMSGVVNGIGSGLVIGYAFEFGANGSLVVFLFRIEGELGTFMSVGIEFFLDHKFRNRTGVLIGMWPGVVAELLEVDDGAVLAFEGVGGEFVVFGGFWLHLFCVRLIKVLVDGCKKESVCEVGVVSVVSS